MFDDDVLELQETMNDCDFLPGSPFGEQLRNDTYVNKDFLKASRQPPKPSPQKNNNLQKVWQVDENLFSSPGMAAPLSLGGNFRDQKSSKNANLGDNFLPEDDLDTLPVGSPRLSPGIHNLRKVTNVSSSSTNNPKAIPSFDLNVGNTGRNQPDPKKDSRDDLFLVESPSNSLNAALGFDPISNVKKQVNAASNRNNTNNNNNNKPAVNNIHNNSVNSVPEKTNPKKVFGEDAQRKRSSSDITVSTNNSNRRASPQTTLPVVAPRRATIPDTSKTDQLKPLTHRNSASSTDTHNSIPMPPPSRQIVESMNNANNGRTTKKEEPVKPAVPKPPAASNGHHKVSPVTKKFTMFPSTSEAVNNAIKPTSEGPKEDKNPKRNGSVPTPKEVTPAAAKNPVRPSTTEKKPTPAPVAPRNPAPAVTKRTVSPAAQPPVSKPITHKPPVAPSPAVNQKASTTIKPTPLENRNYLIPKKEVVQVPPKNTKEAPSRDQPSVFSSPKSLVETREGSPNTGTMPLAQDGEVLASVSAPRRKSRDDSANVSYVSDINNNSSNIYVVNNNRRCSPRNGRRRSSADSNGNDTASSKTDSKHTISPSAPAKVDPAPNKKSQTLVEKPKVIPNGFVSIEESLKRTAEREGRSSPRCQNTAERNRPSPRATKGNPTRNGIVHDNNSNKDASNSPGMADSRMNSSNTLTTSNTNKTNYSDYNHNDEKVIREKKAKAVEEFNRLVQQRQNEARKDKYRNSNGKLVPEPSFEEVVDDQSAKKWLKPPPAKHMVYNKENKEGADNGDLRMMTYSDYDLLCNSIGATYMAGKV